MPSMSKKCIPILLATPVFLFISLTCLYSKEYRLALQGNITSGKLNATDRTNPIFITSETSDGVKLIRMFPVNGWFAKAM